MKMNDVPERAYLILGTNLGNREKNLKEAKSFLAAELAPTLTSRIYETGMVENEPWGFEAKQLFLNQGIAFDTTCPPELLLKICKYVEKKMGRNPEDLEYDKGGKRIYHSRIIDIDIVLYGKRKVNMPDLKIPHPQIEERDYAKKIVSQLLKYRAH